MKSLFLIGMFFMASTSFANTHIATCDTVLDPNVDGSAKLTIPELKVEIQQDDNGLYSLAHDWTQPPYLSISILAFNQSCANSFTACEGNTSSARITMTTQYSGGSQPKNHAEFDTASRRLSLEYSEVSTLFRHDIANLVLQCR
jgi:hypothetical protein